MKSSAEIQYVSDSGGNPVSVLVPIELWRQIESEQETAYLQGSPKMKQRLLEAMDRSGGMPFEDVRAKLGV